MLAGGGSILVCVLELGRLEIVQAPQLTVGWGLQEKCVARHEGVVLPRARHHQRQVAHVGERPLARRRHKGRGRQRVKHGIGGGARHVIRKHQRVDGPALSHIPKHDLQ